MSLGGHAARGAATTLGGQWIRFAVQLGTLAVLARLLTPADFGVVSMVLAIAGIATLLGDFGLSMAAIQSQDITQGQRSNLFWINVILGLVLSGGVFALAGPLASFYDRPELVGVTRVLALVFLVNAVAAQFRAETSRRLRFRWLAAADVSAQVIASGAAVTLGLLGAAYWSLVAQQVVVAVVTLGMLVVAAGWRPSRPRRAEPVGSLLRFGVNAVGTQVVNYVSGNADSVLIGRFWGADALGGYDRAYQIFRLPLQQIAAPMTRVAFPVLSRVKDPAVFNRYVRSAQLVLGYGMGGAFFVGAALADPLIEIMLGPGWDASKTLFRVLAIGGAFQSLGFVYYWVFLARGLSGLQLRYGVVGRTLMVAFMVAGVAHGPLGVAIGASSGLVLNWVILTVFAAPRAGIDVRSLVILALRPLAVGLGLVAVSVPMTLIVLDERSSLLKLVVLAGVVLAYLGLVVILSRRVRRDVVEIWSMVAKLRRRRS